MIISVNCFTDKDLAEDFDRSLSEILHGTRKRIQTYRAAAESTPADISGASHVIISGSENSVTESPDWTGRVSETIKRCAHEKLPLLGICFGHQMIAEVLGGTGSVTRAIVPEFGWAWIETADIPLFRNLETDTFMVSHYDIVNELPEDFTVTARSGRCSVNGFQYRDLPVFGIQFHPEYGPGEAEGVFSFLRERDENLDKYMLSKKIGPGHREKTARVIENFVSLY